MYDCIDDEKVLGQDITQFAFYISVVGIELSCSSETYGFASDPINYLETSLYIVNRTYDTLCPASYRSDADYGIKVLTDPENNDYSFLIGGADKHRTELSFDLASKIIGELTKADKKVINDIRKKYDIELEPAEEALLN